MIRWIVLVAGISGCLGVMIGAYAAHGLESALTEQGLATVDVAKRIEQCDVAVRYHLLHSVALLAIGGLAGTQAGTQAVRQMAAVCFGLGLLLFSGGLYSMVFLGEMGHWAIVPSGGLCFMIGWLCVALAAFARPTPP